MRRSTLAVFPFQNDLENDCLARAHNIEDTLLSAIRAFLVTRKGSRVGNMVGSFLPDLMYEIITSKNLTGYAEQLRAELTTQFPGVTFMNVRMVIDKSNERVNLIVTITLSTAATGLTELEVNMPTGQ